MPSDVAVAAEPFSTLSHVAKMTEKMMPETYSGVAVEVMESTDNPRSSRDPSRMPASTPISSETGTMVSITQNISRPVAFSAWGRRFSTLVLKAVEQPKLPCRMPL